MTVQIDKTWVLQHRSASNPATGCTVTMQDGHCQRQVVILHRPDEKCRSCRAPLGWTNGPHGRPKRWFWRIDLHQTGPREGRTTVRDTKCHPCKRGNAVFVENQSPQWTPPASTPQNHRNIDAEISKSRIHTVVLDQESTSNPATYVCMYRQYAKHGRTH